MYTQAHIPIYTYSSFSHSLSLYMDNIFSESKRNVSCEFETQYMCGYDTIH